MTEELGDEHAVDVVERFVADVEHTLPEDARIIKTIGDEVMVVGATPPRSPTGRSASRGCTRTRPLPRIGMHYGEVVYRDGDYYGREVNQAARVVGALGARARCSSRARSSRPPDRTSSSSSSARSG